jgi:TfoX/Sxy family transcriptional regulator of competence genes
MSTRREPVDHLLAQLEPLDARVRAMFGEYALYLGPTIVGFVCDDTLFMKPTGAAYGYQDDLTLAPPYPGASDYLAVGAELVEQPEQLQALVTATAALIPPRKPRASRARAKA